MILGLFLDYIRDIGVSGFQIGGYDFRFGGQGSGSRFLDLGCRV